MIPLAANFQMKFAQSAFEMLEPICARMCVSSRLSEKARILKTSAEVVNIPVFLNQEASSAETDAQEALDIRAARESMNWFMVGDVNSKSSNEICSDAGQADDGQQHPCSRSGQLQLLYTILSRVVTNQCLVNVIRHRWLFCAGVMKMRSKV